MSPEHRADAAFRWLLPLVWMAAALAALRPMRAPPALWVEVVTDAGIWRVQPEAPTLASALSAAGDDGNAAGVDGGRPVRHGDRLARVDGRWAVVRPADPALYGRRVDVDLDGVEALRALPGTSEALAQAIVDDRTAQGPFFGPQGLDRVRGVGPSWLMHAAPWIAFAVQGPPPEAARVDLNHASAEALEALPGIGPTLAGRIVADRAARGPFRRTADLDRVRGVGPALLRRLAGRVGVTR